jgi:hypothetical protein
VCKELLEAVAKTQAPTSNPILINTLFDMARSLHDSIGKEFNLDKGE